MNLNETSVAVTGEATEVTDRSAKLTGGVNLELITITYRSIDIDYGVQLAMDADFTSLWGIVPGRELVEGQFTVDVTNLSANEQYWFRTYVRVPDFSYFGQGRTFTTKKRITTDTCEYVDLGLPSGTLWATCNVGAKNPEDYGDYFAWGETKMKTPYDWSNYKYCNGSAKTLTKYCTDSDYGTVDNKTELELEDDAAYVNWGDDWRMPSYDQLNELINSSYTTTEWTKQNEVPGRKITSKSNGKSIFLPAPGTRGGKDLAGAGSTGHYWSRTLATSYTYSGCILIGYWEGIYTHDDSYGSRQYGCSVRPVYVPQ